MKMDKPYKLGLHFSRAGLPAHTASNHKGTLPKAGDDPFRVRRNMRIDTKKDKMSSVKPCLQRRAEPPGALGRLLLKAGLDYGV